MTEKSEFERAWAAWQDRRAAAVSAPYGPASLVLTYWFADEAPREVAGVPGRWAALGERLVASDFEPGAYSHLDGGAAQAPLVIGGEVNPDEARAGAIAVRVFERDGVRALRVFDPEAPGRRSLEGIEAFQPSESWRLDARFEPETQARTIELVDGYQKHTETSGSIVFHHGGEEYRLTGTLGSENILVVFGDTTNGSESYGFRFLNVALPDPEGRTVIDFNRAYLPPCAFSDQFVCPLPTPENRLPIPIRAGEKVARRNASS